LKLFKTPNPQVIFDPFLGSGSIGMAAKLLGYEFIGCELDPEYFEIAKLRIQYAIDNKFKLNRTFDTKHEPKNKKPTVNDNDFF
jgi:DNA modification methylase